MRRELSLIASHTDTYALFGSGKSSAHYMIHSGEDCLTDSSTRFIAIVMINAGVVINEDGNFVAPGPQPNGPQGRIEGNSRRGLPWSG